MKDDKVVRHALKDAIREETAAGDLRRAVAALGHRVLVGDSEAAIRAEMDRAVARRLARPRRP